MPFRLDTHLTFALQKYDMYAYIKGTFTAKKPTEVYCDVGGVGYHIHISLHTYGQIEQDEEGMLFTYLHVKEDAQTLYGFATEEEKALFILLISISGIGPNTARIILSYMTPLEVRTAIVNDDDSAFRKVKGVGPKTAKRVTLELKDKVKRGDAITSTAPSSLAVNDSDKALAALLALGFQKQKVTKTLDGLNISSEMSTEDIIKLALQHLR